MQQDIHGIRPPVQIGFDPGLLNIILMLAGGIVLISLLFFLIKKYVKKRKSLAGPGYLPEPLAPYEAAVKELDSLLQGQMNDPRLFYFDLTAVLRKYIGRSFGINAIEMTSQEFIRSINTLDFDRVLKKDIALFQTDCDPIKYAGIVPEQNRVKQDFSFVKGVIVQIEQDLIKLRAKQVETQ